MEIIPYSRQSIDEADIAAVTAVLKAPFLTQGPAVSEFETAFADRHGGGEAVAVSNATCALHIACVALDVGPGDLVWTSPNSFVASANCARYCGADVDFVDIDPTTRNIDVVELEAKLEVAQKAGRLPKVVIPVDFAGLPSDMPTIRKLADRYGFSVIEDASHAIGATIDGEPLGARYADIAVFSFHPVKIITTGEGGLCLTKNAALAERLRMLRSHGITRDTDLMKSDSDGPWYYEQSELGFNYRMTDLQAALGSSQLQRLDVMWDKRQALARRYDTMLADTGLKLPARLNSFQSAHHLYVVEVPLDEAGTARKRVFEHLVERGIRPNVHYIPIHTHPDFERLGFKRGMFPNAEKYYDRAITIPLYPDLTEDEQDRVVAALHEAIAEL